MKDFDSWNSLKQLIEKRHPQIVKSGQIWWCSVGKNIGDEENGKNFFHERPVLILKKFNRRFCFAVPLTSQPHETEFHHKIESIENGTHALLSQGRSLSTKRMRRLVTIISLEERQLIVEKVYNILRR